jgi:hypothetical protein
MGPTPGAGLVCRSLYGHNGMTGSVTFASIVLGCGTRFVADDFLAR